MFSDQYMSFVGLKTAPSPNLMLPCREVQNFEANALSWVGSKMYGVMIPGGIGLAAPQIGINLAIATLNQALDCAELAPALVNIDGKDMYMIINPKIECLGHRNFVLPGLEQGEGCLSLPPAGKVSFTGVVHRYKEINLLYYDISGKDHSVRLSGYPAVVVQHECDHLFGKVFPSRMHNHVERELLISNYAAAFGLPRLKVKDFVTKSESNPESTVKSDDEIIARAEKYGVSEDDLSPILNTIKALGL